MSAPPSVDLLLSEWQRQAQAGQAVAPEQLCRDCPELLDELRRCIDVQQRIEHLAGNLGRGAGATAVDKTARSDQHTVAAGLAEPNAGSPGGALPELPELPGYELLRRLGTGGMGVVYEARDRQLGRLVAIKMLRDGEGAADARGRLLSEAKAVACLNHPHIVQLFAAGEHAGRPYLVMELVAGPSLYQLRRPLTPPEAARLVLLLAGAVQAAHACRIVHRDLKPSNVLLAPPAADPALNSACGCPKVADFGLARWLDAEHGLTRTGDAAGTPSYMAPEQAQGRLREVGPATDVYGLGAILYELLTRRPPFAGSTFAAVLMPLLHDDPVAPRRLQPEVPADLETICLKCLRKEPGRRYATAQALAADLGRFLRGEPIEARPVGRLEQAWKWARREPLVVGLGSAIVAALLLALVALAYGWHHAERARTLEAQRAVDAERQRLEQDRLYRFQVQIADRDLADARPDLAERALGNCPEGQRQWEWYHLRHRCQQPPLAALRGHGARVTSVAAAHAGNRFASAGNDGVICVWQRDRPAPVQRWTGHRGAVLWLAWTPDGDEVISGGADQRVLLWEVATGQHRQFAGHDGPVFCLAVHPHEPWVASTTFEGAQAGEILLWDRQTLKVLHRLRGHRGRVSGLAFSPDGARLASASHDQTVMLWDPRDGSQVRTFQEHAFPVGCVAFSPDGQALASAAGPVLTQPAEHNQPTDSEVLIWSPETGAVRQRLRGDFSRTVALAFAPQGHRLATGGWARRIKIWDAETGQEVLRLSEHTEAIMSLAFAADGTLISGSLDGTVRLWPAPSRKR